MLIDVIALTFLAGLAAFSGAVLGWFENIKKDWLTCESRHGIMAFGGGALFAAVALVLVPKGMAGIPLHLSATAFLAGAVFFLFLDACFRARKSPLSQFMAMMLDFVPEALVLGAIITSNYNEAIFLAALIAAQNMPEGFNSYREMTAGSHSMGKWRALGLMAAGSVSGIGWGVVGYTMFSPDDLLLKLLMMFCAGGIFSLVFQDIAPESHVKTRWSPSLGAAFGFLLGIIGHGLV